MTDNKNKSKKVITSIKAEKDLVLSVEEQFEKRNPQIPKKLLTRKYIVNTILENYINAK